MPRSAPRTAFAIGTSVGMAGVFLPLAVQLAFLPVWLEDIGFSADQIGVLLGAPIAVRVVTTPPLVALADRVGDRRLLFVAFALAAFIASLGLLVATSFAAVLAISIVISVTTAVAIPLADAIALSGVRRLRLDYGTMRLWGSVAFIAGTVLAGWWLARAGPSGVPAALALALLITVLAGLALPRSKPRARNVTGTSRLRADRVLVLASASAALTIGSQAMFYGFGSIHWTALGFSGPTVGALWGIGVLSEIALFALAPRMLPSLTPVALLAAGATLGIVRWAMFPFGETVAFYVVNSVLHAGSFGAAHLGIQRLIGVRVPDARQGAAQGLAFAVSGPTMAVATFASGALYGVFGVSAFLAMAAMCVAGLALALAAAQPQRVGEGGETIEPV